MSIGPKPQKEEFKMNYYTRTKATIKRAFTNYFKNPVHYIFFGALTLTVIGLLLKTRFPVELYAILVVLGITEIFTSNSKNQDGSKQQ